MSALGQYEKIRALVSTPKFVITAGVSANATSEVVIATRDLKISFFELPTMVSAMALASDDSVWCACTDGTLRLHKVSDLKEVKKLSAHEGEAHSVAVSADGKSVVSVGSDGFARVFDSSNGAKRGEYKLSAQALRAVACDPGGESIAAAGDDGNVYIVTLSNSAVRTMSGHSGAVFSLAYTPRDGRIASGGEDGTVRLWYVVGESDCEIRGQDDTGHVGGVTAIAFIAGDAEPNGDVSERFVTVGMDGNLRSWPLGSRRKPKTLGLSSKPIYALSVVPAKQKSYENNTDFQRGRGLLTGGDDRNVRFVGLEKGESVQDHVTVFEHAFQVFETRLKGQTPARQSALELLCKREEEEAQALLLTVLESDREPSLRLMVAKHLHSKVARWARSALIARLRDSAPTVRTEAFAALRAIDGQDALAPLRFALESGQSDVMCEAIRVLSVLRESSPIAEGLIIERLSDGNAEVRSTALDELCAGYDAADATPLKIAYERGAEDIVIGSLVRAAQAGLTGSAAFSQIFARALDHETYASVRRTAFALRVIHRSALFAHLSTVGDDDINHAVGEIARYIAIRARGTAAKQMANKPVTAEELASAMATLPTEPTSGAKPTEEDLEPLLSAMACRTPETALRGAKGLAHFLDTRALGALLQLSREGDAKLRSEAAKALRSLEDPRANRRLVWMLDDGDASVRGVALESYAKLASAQPLTVAEAALRSAYEDVRVRGLDRLVKLDAKKAANDTRAESLLGDALEDEAEKVRAEAFRTLWAWHTTDPVKALDRALEGRFADLRLRAVTELATRVKEQWALDRLIKTIGDRDDGVAKAAFDTVVTARGKADPEAYLKAMESVLATQRARGAEGAKESTVEALRAGLTKLLQDEHSAVRIAAVDTLDALLKSESGPLYAALQSGFYDLKVRAAEHLAQRKDEQIIEPMRSLILDKELNKRFAASLVESWRTRATQALATLGSPKVLKLFAAELLTDEVAGVREGAARGLSVASRPGDEGFLLDALSHADVAVRSWAADGLARLGDVRALPVLTGNLKNPHLPIRIGAILSFAALGPEGFGGMLQGLEDADRAVQERVFALILARDLRANRLGETPSLLVSALSSQRAEVRFAAARALELRSDPEDYLAYLIEVLLPPKPEKAADLKSWPNEEVRGRIMVALAEALASDLPEQRYAAAHVLNLRNKPVAYFVAAQETTKLRALGTPWVPDNKLRAPEESDVKASKGWLRKLYVEGVEEKDAKKTKGDDKVQSTELLQLAFGAYVGMLRQSTSDDDAQRVRRDSIERIVALSKHEAVGHSAALSALVRALDADHHLVRKAALSGLKKLLKNDVDRALALALDAQYGDVARAALDELAARGESERARIAKALNASVPDVRKYAFELLEKLSPKGSLEPLIAALASKYSDLRLGVIERLAQSADPRVSEALLRALSSEHDDLRMRAAELLADRKDKRCADVLGLFLRHDQGSYVQRAGRALVRLPAEASVPLLATRLDELGTADDQHAERVAVLRLLGSIRHALAMEVLATRLHSESESLRSEAFANALALAGHDREKRNHALLLPFLREAVESKDALLRARAAAELDLGDDSSAESLLVSLFADRDVPTRVTAVQRYAQRVIHKKASVEPLRAVLAAGARELVLGAAEGVAHTGDVLAFRPLLLVMRAGQPDERPRAILSLGSLGDPRALSELELVADGGSEESPVEPAMEHAAVEALGRLWPKLLVVDEKKRVLERLEQTLLDGKSSEHRKGAARGLRYVGGETARVQLEASLLFEWQPSEVRVTCAESLAALGDPQAEAPLAKAMYQWDYSLRIASRKALDTLFASDRVRVEFHALDAPHEEMAEAAAAYLANEGDIERLVPRLATLENLEQRVVLRSGIERRGKIPVDACARVLDGEDTQGRVQVARLVGTLAESLDDAGRKTLTASLLRAVARAQAQWTADRTREFEAAAWRESYFALTRVDARAAAKLARDVLDGGEARSPAMVRREALRVLSALAESSDRPRIVTALTDPDASVRRLAVDVLAQQDIAAAAKTALKLEPFDPVSLRRVALDEGVRDELLRDPRGRKVVLAAAIAAGQSTVLAQMATLATDAAERMEAVSALGRVGGAVAKETLALVAKDKKGASAELRKAAYAALKRAVRDEKRQTRWSTSVTLAR
ncbi:MAG: HEAT repeat domain-containing protein [Deltaproteobacteria bacterium]|nr:HEAT repeat domain-containing protein [Deltaproteobacteria bacterium]